MTRFLVTPEDWMEDAACKGRSTRLFFPERGDSNVLALKICAGCPVQVECLDYALSTGQTHGVWGGTSERERRQQRRAQVRRPA